MKMIFKNDVVIDDMLDILVNKMKSNDVVEIEATNERDVFTLTVRENDKLINLIKKHERKLK